MENYFRMSKLFSSVLEFSSCTQSIRGALVANYGGKFHWTLLVTTEIATIVASGKRPLDYN